MGISLNNPPSGFKKGMIILWSGSIATIPSGWHLCDGSNSTPDLRNSFVVCAGNTYNVGDTGGSTTTSTGYADLLDSGHFHSTGNSGMPPIQLGTGTAIPNVGMAGSYDSVCTGETDDHDSAIADIGHTHTITPPYYSLAYIMKT